MRSDLVDPYLVLGIDESSGDARVREAYLAAVRRHPPESSPDEFARIASAYEQIRTEMARMRHRYTGPIPHTWEEAREMIPATGPPTLPTRQKWLEAGIRVRAAQAADRAADEPGAGNGDQP